MHLRLAAAPWAAFLVVVLASLPASAETPAAGLSPARTAPTFRPFSVDLIETNDTHALLKMGRRMGRDFYYGVLDLGTGCVSETAPSFPRVERVIHQDYRVASHGSRQPRHELAATTLAEPDTQAEIRRYIAFRSRFGSRKDEEPIYRGDFAWSADASKIVVVAGETLFRSRDGGRSYELLDTNMSGNPHVTRDGRFAFYQRCGDPSVHDYSCLKAQQVGIVDLESASKPRIVDVGRGTIEGLDPTGQKLVFVRDDEPGKVIVNHLDPTSGGLGRAFSIAAPHLAPKKFFTIDPSRGGKFGTFDYWTSDTVQKVTVVSMLDGRVLYQQQRQFVGVEVDDDGRLAWGTVNGVRAFAATPTGVVKDAGAGDRIGWAPGGRLLVYRSPSEAEESGTLDDVKCKLVKVVRVSGS